VTELATQLLWFRFEFDLKKLRPESQFKVELISLGSEVKVWANGFELVLDERVKRGGRHEFTIPPLKANPPKSATEILGSGKNVFAAQVKASCKPGEMLFQLRFDELKRPVDLPKDLDANVAEEVVETLVTSRAVVCDLCSKVPGQTPACVTPARTMPPCASMPRTQFPTR